MGKKQSTITAISFNIRKRTLSTKWFNSRICFPARLWHLGPRRPAWKQPSAWCDLSGSLWGLAIGILSRKPLLPRQSDRVPWSSHVSRALGRPTGPAGQP